MSKIVIVTLIYHRHKSVDINMSDIWQLMENCNEENANHAFEFQVFDYFFTHDERLRRCTVYYTSVFTYTRCVSYSTLRGIHM
jgi:hypothetical protein